MRHPRSVFMVHEFRGRLIAEFNAALFYQLLNEFYDYIRLIPSKFYSE